jgi:hypothetical protein
MYLVQVCVPRADFANALGTMREWLDNRKCPAVRFETAAEGDAVRIALDFPSESLAEAFRQEFSVSAAD